MEVSLLATVFSLSGVGAITAGQWLRHTVSPSSVQPHPLLVPLSVATGFLTAVTFALVLSFVARIVNSSGEFAGMFWSDAAQLLQDFALWITIHWIFLWGLPFMVGMATFFYLQPGHIALALAAAILVALVLIIILWRVLPRDVWRVSQFDPSNRLGWKRGVLLFVVLTSVGTFRVWSCYVFDVSISASNVARSNSSVEVRAILSGRIAGHDLLAAQAVAVRGKWRSVITDFDTEDPGTYVTWIDMTNAPAGIYRITVFFRESPTASALDQIERQLRPRKFRKSFLIRVL